MSMIRITTLLITSLIVSPLGFSKNKEFTSRLRWVEVSEADFFAWDNKADAFNGDSFGPLPTILPEVAAIATAAKVPMPHIRIIPGIGRNAYTSALPICIAGSVSWGAGGQRVTRF